MSYIAKISMEAIVVGLLFGAILAIAIYFYPVKTPFLAFMVGIVVGIAGHLLMEAMGVNAWYVKNGAAALKGK